MDNYGDQTACITKWLTFQINMNEQQTDKSSVSLKY